MVRRSSGTYEVAISRQKGTGAGTGLRTSPHARFPQVLVEAAGSAPGAEL